MGLDIYAGTLTRYYSHNWKTVVQQWAEKNGYTFNRITPDGEPADDGEELSPAEVQAAVENWRDQILAAIAQPGQEPYAPWPEDNEKPYYTDKPDWDAFGAMLLVAACHTYGEPVPPTVEKNWDFGEHPLISRLASDEERVWSLFRGATWWLPLSDAFFFQAPLPTDDQAMLDLKQQILADRIAEHPEISVVWFRADKKKDGGQYVTTTGQLKKVDDIERTLRLVDGTTIPLDDVLELRSDCFHGIFQDG